MSNVRYYFVDEAGDPTLFTRREKRNLIGTEGVSTFFILGLLDVAAPRSLAEDFSKLREELLALRQNLWVDSERVGDSRSGFLRYGRAKRMEFSPEF